MNPHCCFIPFVLNKCTVFSHCIQAGCSLLPQNYVMSINTLFCNRHVLAHSNACAIAGYQALFSLPPPPFESLDSRLKGCWCYNSHTWRILSSGIIDSAGKINKKKLGAAFRWIFPKRVTIMFFDLVILTATTTRAIRHVDNTR